MNANVVTPAQKFVNRQNRAEHPRGKFDGAGRWYPSEAEHCDCCNAVRSPSRAWPYSLMLHCRTAKHIAHLYEVDEAELKREAKRIRSVEQSAAVMATA